MNKILLGFFLAVLGLAGPLQAQTTAPDYQGILDEFNAALEDHVDQCGYRIGNSVWAIGGGIVGIENVIVGEVYALDGGENMRLIFRLDVDVQELTLPGPAHSLYLRRNDLAGAVTFRVCNIRADGSPNCTIFGDTYDVCFLYG